MKRRRRQRKTRKTAGLLKWAVLGIAAAVLIAWLSMRSSQGFGEKTVMLLTTGYCNCESCCGWTTNEFGSPVYNYGRLKGRPKIVGLTSTGTVAKRGTVAADPKFLPMGTRLIVPGYGFGQVEDIGGAIKGKHIDLWFPSHEEAKRWGRRTIPVVIRGK